MTANALPEVTVINVSALHIAHLEPLAGVGFIVCPSPDDDVWLSGSLNGADWDSAIAVLRRMGWEPLTDDGDSLIAEGATHDGGPVFALISADPIVSVPDLGEYVRAREALVMSAGLVE